MTSDIAYSIFEVAKPDYSEAKIVVAMVNILSLVLDMSLK